jgi:hypothetical protein
MVKMTVKETKVKPPPPKITLELGLEEAAILAKLCGCITHSGQIRRITDTIYDVLVSNDRIHRLSLDIEHDNIDLEIPIGNWKMPQEQ